MVSKVCWHEYSNGITVWSVETENRMLYWEVVIGNAVRKFPPGQQALTQIDNYIKRYIGAG